MATIEIPKVRKESTVIMYVSLTDNGVTVDWTSLSEIKPFMYSDEQHCIAGKCTAEIATGAPETLIVRYPTTAPQFLGQNSLLIRCTYDGNEKSFDVPVLEFVDRSSEATGVTVIEDPELPVAIEVQDVDTSVLDDAIAAALDAAAKATAAAELVPLDILAQCQAAAEAATAAAENASPRIAQNGNWEIYDFDEGEYVDSGNPSRGIQGVQGEKGDKGDKGDQGNTGSSVAYPYELVNNLTTDDATKGLSAAQGVALAGEISQLDQKLTYNKASIKSKIIDFSDANVIIADYSIKTDGTFGTSSSYKHARIPLNGETQLLITANSSAFTRIAFFFNDITPVSGGTLPLVSGTSCIELNVDETRVFDIPDGALSVAVYLGSSSGYPSKPSVLKMGKLDLSNIEDAVADIQEDITTPEFTPLETTSTLSGQYLNSNGTTSNLSFYSIKLVDVSLLQGKDIRIVGNCVALTAANNAYGFYKSTTLSNDTAIKMSSRMVNESFSIIVTVPKGATTLALVQEYSHADLYFNSSADSVTYTSKLDKTNGATIEYIKTGDTIVVGGLFKQARLGITLGRGGANNLFDFRNIFTFSKDSSVATPANVSYIIPSVGDMHAPFRFRDDGGTESVVFTGGNHDASSHTLLTAVSNYVKMYADGELLGTNATGFCSSLRLEWQNDVKAGNAYAETDTYALRETHTMTFDGIKFDEWVDLEPLKNINMGLWYGFECVPLANQTSIQFAGAANRKKNGVAEGVTSGDKTCAMVINESGVAQLLMCVDNSFDLGARGFVDSTTRGAFLSGDTGKSYFTIISSDNYEVNMATGDHYWLHGYYKILPV